MNPDPEATEDPYGYRDDVLEALAHPGFDTDSQPAVRSEAAASLCEALGRCRLFGIPLEESIDGVVPNDVAQLASAQVRNDLEDWILQANELPDRWDAATDPTEADDLCGGLLQARMDVWATWLAIDESYSRWLTVRAPEDESFDAELDQLLEALEEFDAALRKQVSLLSTIADWHLLDNWRAELADEYQSALPWWLDGTLEDAFHELADTAEADLPDEEAWRHLSGQPVVLPLRERTFSFEVQSDLAMMAATPQSKLVVQGEGSELWILQHGDPDLVNVQLKSPANVQVEALLLNGVPVELVEDWDDEQEAVVRKEPFMRTLQSGGKIQVQVRESADENDS